MLNPAIGKLIDKYDNRYQLVLMVAKKARDMAAEAEARGEVIVEKPVSLAIDALAADGSAPVSAAPAAPQAAAEPAEQPAEAEPKAETEAEA